MNNTTNIKKNVAIDFSIYYNGETGESLASELVNLENKTMVSVKEDTELVTMKRPDNFAFIDTDVLLKIIELLSNNDLAHVLKLIPTTKTEMNMVYNHSVPHTNASLQKYLKILNKTAFH